MDEREYILRAEIYEKFDELTSEEQEEFIDYCWQQVFNKSYQDEYKK